MVKKVNFSRHVEVFWLNQTALWAAEGLTKPEINDKINLMLSSQINCKVNLGKTRNQLTSLWVDSDELIKADFTETAVNLVHEYEELPLALHFGLLVAKKKFFADVVRFIGRHSKLNEYFTYAQAQKKVVELYGDTETVKRSLRSVLKTLVELGFIQRSDNRNYVVAKQKLSVPKNLKNWLLSAVLYSENARSRTLSDLLDDAVWFPFEFYIDPAEIDKNLFEIHHQGNDEMLFLK